MVCRQSAPGNVTVKKPSSSGVIVSVLPHISTHSAVSAVAGTLAICDPGSRAKSTVVVWPAWVSRNWPTVSHRSRTVASVPAIRRMATR